MSNYNYNNYENFYDPDTWIKMIGASIGWGKRLRWPDDYFTLSASLSYTRYMMKKKVISIALIIALIAVIAAGSFAYFTDNDKATNTSTISILLLQ